MSFIWYVWESQQKKKTWKEFTLRFTWILWFLSKGWAKAGCLYISKQSKSLFNIISLDCTWKKNNDEKKNVLINQIPKSFK